jgi:hypothetical protein
MQMDKFDIYVCLLYFLDRNSEIEHRLTIKMSFLSLHYILPLCEIYNLYGDTVESKK